MLGVDSKKIYYRVTQKFSPQRGKGQNTPGVAIYPIEPEPAQRGASFINR